MVSKRNAENDQRRKLAKTKSESCSMARRAMPVKDSCYGVLVDQLC